MIERTVSMESELPRGTVTFLFTDIAGSTKLFHHLGVIQWHSGFFDNTSFHSSQCPLYAPPEFADFRPL